MTTAESPESPVDELEVLRRLSGLNFVELGRRSGLTPKRIRRFFREDAPLRRTEIVKLREILEAETAGITRPL